MILEGGEMINESEHTHTHTTPIQSEHSWQTSLGD